MKKESKLPVVVIATIKEAQIITEMVHPHLDWYDGLPRDEKRQNEKVAVVLYVEKNTK